MQKTSDRRQNKKTNGDPVKLRPQDAAFLLSEARVAFLLRTGLWGPFLFLAQLPIIYLTQVISIG
jgi:hypothetical protein